MGKTTEGRKSIRPAGQPGCRFILAAWLLCLPALAGAAGESLPLPEHPRPDWKREAWLNLNGDWEFRFDPEDVGREQQWFRMETVFPLTIRVPFPWGSPLSGVPDEAPIAWYRRQIEIPADWRGGRVFLVVGASDWETTAWLDGELLGVHQGGYIPFEFELGGKFQVGQTHSLVLRVDDRDRPFKLEGKQGYGNARGIWQTVYLENRGEIFLSSARFLPDLEREEVEVQAELSDPAAAGTTVELEFLGSSASPVRWSIPEGAREFKEPFRLEDPRLWTLEDPYLYQVRLILRPAAGVGDQVETYFGMREIGVGRVPGKDYTYVTLNGKPVYLQMTLDQAYHPEGYYTFPDDAFVRDEIVRSLKLGLNGMRVHVKTPLPRKLYWADRLGMLIMADVPNSWGEPTPEMREEIEKTFTAMVRRDFNHPSVFAWVLFNETWGLMHRDRGYLPETQKWVEDLYHRAKELDPTRLVEDNSANRGDHVATDLNTWHAYLPGYRWEEFLEEVERQSYPGSNWNFVEGKVQGDQPVLNSECGNVWGYEGSTGDVDWSWDYHRMLNAFRRHMKIGGWLYTEHHDVINEWNGYYRYDRSEKETGLGELLPGMSIRDWHGPVYVAVGGDAGQEVRPGEEVEIPLYLSVLDLPSRLIGRVRVSVHGWDDLGRRFEAAGWERAIRMEAWDARALEPLRWTAPQERSLVIVAAEVIDSAGTVMHRNFTTFSVTDGRFETYEQREVEDGRLHLLRVSPAQYADAKWEDGFVATVLDGLKVNGARHGYFEYTLEVPRELAERRIVSGFFLAELSARSVLGRDVPEGGEVEGDYMRGGGAHDPGLNPNAYPMTDEKKHPSLVWIRVDDQAVGRVYLPDDPADHRGILSWIAQPRDGRLYEAGTYGELVRVEIPAEFLQRAAQRGALRLRLEVDSGFPGGLAVYGDRFGRYPVAPTIGVITER
ncbi:MAG TPA: glycoside hydrolase family 2 TIM barrel-domain containing protein [Acidobacteriota bacterium]|nr:glycoside hydrolase family 2 TIM barrel-domain containing protein [Acidobacteriota bacterium]